VNVAEDFLKLRRTEVMVVISCGWAVISGGEVPLVLTSCVLDDILKCVVADAPGNGEI
jgi:hypothetical protein